MTGALAAGATGVALRPWRDGPALVMAVEFCAPGVAPDFGGVEEVGALEVIEVEAGVELVAAADVFGAEGDGVGIAEDDFLAVGEGGLELVVLIFGGAGGDDAEALVAGVVGVGDDGGFPMAAVGADGAPFVGGAAGGVAFEVAVLDETRWSCFR